MPWLDLYLNCFLRFQQRSVPDSFKHTYAYTRTILCDRGARARIVHCEFIIRAQFKHKQSGFILVFFESFDAFFVNSDFKLIFVVFCPKYLRRWLEVVNGYIFVQIFGRELFMVHFGKKSDGFWWKIFPVDQMDTLRRTHFVRKISCHKSTKSIPIAPKTIPSRISKKNVFPFATSRDDFLFHVIRVIHSNKKFERNGCFFSYFVNYHWSQDIRFSNVY